MVGSAGGVGLGPGWGGDGSGAGPGPAGGPPRRSQRPSPNQRAMVRREGGLAWPVGRARSSSMMRGGGSPAAKRASASARSSGQA